MAAPPSCVWPEGTATLHLQMKTPTPPAATDHERREDQRDALAAPARARDDGRARLEAWDRLRAAAGGPADGLRVVRRRRSTQRLQTSSRRPTLAKRRVRILAFGGASNADYIFNVTNAMVMTYFASRSWPIVIFIIQLLLSLLHTCFCEGFYFFGGFFLARRISTASMIFDVHWLDVWPVEISQCVVSGRRRVDDVDDERAVKL